MTVKKARGNFPNILSGQIYDTIDPANIPTPASGKFVLFNDSTNSNALSVKDDTGTVSEVGANGGGVDIQTVWAFNA